MRWSRRRLTLMCLAAILVTAGGDALWAGTEPKKKVETTALQVHVTGVDDAKPVRGAIVHLEWTEDGQTVDRDTTTNGQGLAEFRLPRGSFVIQVLAPSSEWESTGTEGEATQERQTITIGLKRKVPEEETSPPPPPGRVRREVRPPSLPRASRQPRAWSASSSQPSIIPRPPIGVTAPSQRGAPRAMA